MLEQTGIIEKTLDVYKRCDVKTFPIDCFKIITGLGISLYKYSDLPEAKIKKCLQISNDAFTIQGTIFFNDKFPHEERQRFSLMHEVGHIVLKHTGDCINNEKEADYFASHILAPRSLIWHLGRNTVKDIYNTFFVSCMAANKILEDFNTTDFQYNQKLHMSIRDWFFPNKNNDLCVQIDNLPEDQESDLLFFNTYRYIMGDNFIFERSEHYHLHGYNSY